MSCANCDCDQCKFDRKLKQIQEDIERKIKEVRNETDTSV